MRLPSWKDVEITWDRQNILDHAGSKSLNLILFRAVKT